MKFILFSRSMPTVESVESTFLTDYIQKMNYPQNSNSIYLCSKKVQEERGTSIITIKKQKINLTLFYFNQIKKKKKILKTVVGYPDSHGRFVNAIFLSSAIRWLENTLELWKNMELATVDWYKPLPFSLFLSHRLTNLSTHRKDIVFNLPNSWH